MSDLARLGRMSVILSRIALGLIVALPMLTIVVWLRFDIFGQELSSHVVKGWCDGKVPTSLSPMQTTLGILAMMLPTAAVMIGLAYLRKLLAGFAIGQIFTIENITALRNFAWAIAIAIVLDIVSNSMISVILTFNNAPGHRELTIGIGSDQVLTIFAGAIFAVIARVMEMGRSLAAKNAEFL